MPPPVSSYPLAHTEKNPSVWDLPTCIYEELLQIDALAP